jgi:hypothetical protein
MIDLFLYTKNEAHMLKNMGFSSGAAANWKRRGKVPFEAIQVVSGLTGCLVDWILTGTT